MVVCIIIARVIVSRRYMINVIYLTLWPLWYTNAWSMVPNWELNIRGTHDLFLFRYSTVPVYIIYVYVDLWNTTYWSYFALVQFKYLLRVQCIRTNILWRIMLWMYYVWLHYKVYVYYRRIIEISSMKKVSIPIHSFYWMSLDRYDCG